MQSIAIVVRDFQGGAGREDEFGKIQPLNSELFSQKADTIVQMLDSPLVSHIFIVGNRDPFSKFGESADAAGNTPTWLAYQERFPALVDDKRIQPVFVDEWGQNAGSGRAVQAGVDRALQTGCTHVLAWSPELEIDQDLLSRAMAFMGHYNLDGVGFLRERFYERPQWMLPQHTGLVGTRAFWEAAPIPLYADGDEGITIETEAGPALLAGMDDMARLLEVLKVMPNLRIGMYGWSQPLPWNIDLTDERQQKKIARQWAVLHEWTRHSFPDRCPKNVVGDFIKYHLMTI